MASCTNPLSTYNYSQTLGRLFDDANPYALQIPEKEFKAEVRALVAYVLQKAGNRCTSHTLRKPTRLEEKVDSLYMLCTTTRPVEARCEWPILRHIVKHDASNDNNREFIKTHAVAGHLKTIPNSGKLKESPVFCNWLTDLVATLVSPAIAAGQGKWHAKLPKELADRLTEGRGRIGKELIEAHQKGLLSQESLETIITRLKAWTEELKFDALSLEEPTITDRITLKYRKLIESGGEHKLVFRDRLVSGLETLRYNPIFKEIPFSAIKN